MNVELPTNERGVVDHSSSTLSKVSGKRIWLASTLARYLFDALLDAS